MAATRLTLAREAVLRISEENNLPAENLIAPDSVRRLLWQPPDADTSAVADRLREYGARAWQIELVAPAMVTAITDAPGAATDPQA